jgi:hypothetical protein
MAKAKLGTGTRFKTLTRQLAARKVGKTARGRKMAKALPGKTEKVKNPAALAAWIGRKKFGKTKFQKMAAAGRKRKK